MEWKFDSDRDFPMGYVLTTLEKRFILYGETGDYSKSEREKLPRRIDEAASDLPLRLSDLITDLHLFYEYGSLKNENWTGRPGFSNLFNFYSDVTSSGLATDVPQTGPSSPYDSPTKFGLELGSALRLIFEANNCTDEFQTVLWGLVLSEITTDSVTEEEQGQQLDDLRDYFREKFDETRPEIEREILHAEKAQESFREFKRKIRTLLMSNSIQATEEKISIVANRCDIDDPTSLKREDVANHLESFIEQYSVQIKLIDYIISNIETDCEEIRNQPLNGVSVDDLLEKMGSELIEPDIKVSTPTEQSKRRQYKLIEPDIKISTLTEQSIRSQDKVTQALRTLYNNYDKGNWPQYPITKEFDDGVWGLTGYGKLITYLMFENGDYHWLYESVFDDSKPVAKFTRDMFLHSAANEILKSESDKPESEIGGGRWESTIAGNRSLIEDLYLNEVL